MTAAAIALALWAGVSGARAEEDTGQGLPWAFEPLQEMVLAPPGETLHAAYQFYPSDKFPDGAARTLAQAEGTLELRVKDHRNAIDDFRRVDLRFGKLRLAPGARLRSNDPGWLELAPRVDRMDLTRYKDGVSAATVYRGALPPGRFAAVDLQVTDIRGILRKTGAPDRIKNAVGPIRLAFEVKPAATTVVILDLELLDLSDHPGRGYELLIKGYELYENDRLLQKIPPG